MSEELMGFAKVQLSDDEISAFAAFAKWLSQDIEFFTYEHTPTYRFLWFTLKGDTETKIHHWAEPYVWEFIGAPLFTSYSENIKQINQLVKANNGEIYLNHSLCCTLNKFRNKMSDSYGVYTFAYGHVKGGELSRRLMKKKNKA